MNALNPSRPNTITTIEIFRITFSLVVFYVIFGGMITVVNFHTQPIIKRNVEEKRQAAATGASLMLRMKKVIPEATAVEKMGEWTINEKTVPYYTVKKGDQTIGYAIFSFGHGYQSLIETLIGFDLNFKITGIIVLSQAETPGLGDGVMGEEFQKQFRGRDISTLKVTTAGNKNYVQALTGATISSRAVTEDAVKNAVIFLQKTIAAK